MISAASRRARPVDDSKCWTVPQPLLLDAYAFATNVMLVDGRTATSPRGPGDFAGRPSYWITNNQP